MLVVKNYERKDIQLENQVIIPATPINLEDGKSIIYEKEKRQKIIEDGENYARIFLYNKKSSL